jgi:hypothetical protein
MDPAFGLAVRLVRAIERDHRAAVGSRRPANMFEMAPSDSWLALSEPERIVRLGAVCDAVLAEHGLAAGQLHVVAVEPNLLGHPVRAILSFDNAVAAAVKPDLIRQAERRMKRQLDPMLHALHEPLKDQNAIRRL